MKRYKRPAGANLSFNDMLFNILIGFVMLFIIAFLLINPITKKNDVPTKAEVMVLLSWDDMSLSDMDLWIENEAGERVGFTRKSWGNWYLDKDDLGGSNDTIFIDGVAKIVRVNNETISMRGILPGKYYVAVHAYTYKEEGEPLAVKVKVIDVNPYREWYTLEQDITIPKQIVKFPAFEVNKEGDIFRLFDHNRRVVPVRGMGSNIPGGTQGQQ